MVVLHRVSPAGSGPVDSVRTQADGSFRLRYRPIADVLFLLSVRYAGIGYFSAPLPGVDGGSAQTAVDIVVYDTSSVARNAALRGRHVIVSAPDPAGQRAIVEVFELANDTTVTLISARDTAPVWRLHLPASATKRKVVEGEFAPEAVRFVTREVELFAPLPPGVKQLVVSYELPSSAFPLSMPMEHASTVLEVLLEETTGRVEGARLTAQAPVTVGGRRFQRALAQDVDAAAVVSIVLPPAVITTTSTSAWAVIPVVLLAALGAWWFFRRRRSVATAPPTRQDVKPKDAPRIPTEEALARSVATLDALLSRADALDPATRASYQAARVRLMDQLRALLARGAAEV